MTFLLVFFIKRHKWTIIQWTKETSFKKKKIPIHKNSIKQFLKTACDLETLQRMTTVCLQETKQRVNHKEEMSRGGRLNRLTNKIK